MRGREERTVKNAAAKSTAKVAEVNGAEETVNPLDFYGQPDRKISVFFMTSLSEIQIDQNYFKKLVHAK